MEDDDLIPISALQHYLYCPRQCALIHIEQQWAENRSTAEGRLLHQTTDRMQAKCRQGVRVVTGLPLLSRVLGLVGRADVVEFHMGKDGEYAFPVEYKRGLPKAHRADEVQLCAQALCLEEMLGGNIEAGAIFYGKSRRRHDVIFDRELRRITSRAIEETRALLGSGVTPRMDYDPGRCDSCSLVDLCLPKLLDRLNVAAWLRGQL